MKSIFAVILIAAMFGFAAWGGSYGGYGYNNFRSYQNYYPVVYTQPSYYNVHFSSPVGVPVFYSSPSHFRASVGGGFYPSNYVYYSNPVPVRFTFIDP